MSGGAVSPAGTTDSSDPFRDIIDHDWSVSGSSSKELIVEDSDETHANDVGGKSPDNPAGMVMHKLPNGDRVYDDDQHQVVFQPDGTMLVSDRVPGTNTFKLNFSIKDGKLTKHNTDPSVIDPATGKPAEWVTVDIGSKQAFQLEGNTRLYLSEQEDGTWTMNITSVDNRGDGDPNKVKGAMITVEGIGSGQPVGVGAEADVKRVLDFEAGWRSMRVGDYARYSDRGEARFADGQVVHAPVNTDRWGPEDGDGAIDNTFNFIYVGSMTQQDAPAKPASDGWHNGGENFGHAASDGRDETLVPGGMSMESGKDPVSEEKKMFVNVDNIFHRVQTTPDDIPPDGPPYVNPENPGQTGQPPPAGSGGGSDGGGSDGPTASFNALVGMPPTSYGQLTPSNDDDDDRRNPPAATPSYGRLVH